MGAVAGVISLILISTLIPKTGKPDYFPIFLVVALVMAASVLILLWKVKENPLREEREKIDLALDIEEGTVQEEGTVSAPMAPEVKRSLILILISVSFWFMGYNAVTTAFPNMRRFTGGFRAAVLPTVCWWLRSRLFVLIFLWELSHPVSAVKKRFWGALYCWRPCLHWVRP